MSQVKLSLDKIKHITN